MSLAVALALSVLAHVEKPGPLNEACVPSPEQAAQIYATFWASMAYETPRTARDARALPLEINKQFELELRAPPLLCLHINWRVEPFGPDPVEPEDFPGKRFPSGRLQFWQNPYNGPRMPSVLLQIRTVDDGITERNETARLVLSDPRTGKDLWGHQLVSPEQADPASAPETAHEIFHKHFLFTIVDTPRVCARASVGSQYKLQAPDPDGGVHDGLVAVRPDRPIEQCEVVGWTVRSGGAQSLGAKDFKGGRYPTGVLRFPAIEDERGPVGRQFIRFPFAANPRARTGRSLSVLLHEVGRPDRIIDTMEVVLGGPVRLQP